MKALKRILTIALILCCATFVFAGCGKDDGTKSKYDFEVDGFGVDVVLYKFSTTNQLSWELKVKNTTDAENEFKFETIVLKNNGEVVSNGSFDDNRLYSANEYWAIGSTIATKEDFVVGDVLELYYDGVFMCNVTVEEF